MDFITAASIANRPLPHTFLRQLSESSATGTHVTKPLLSPSADAELYVLATNFLLYVAMVIITILVCKIYFPALLEQNRPLEEVSSPPTDANLLELEEEDDAAAAEKTDSDQLIQGEDADAGAAAAAADNDLFWFDQSQTERTTVLKRLVFCGVMLNVTFVTWGVLQERMLTRRYPRFTGEFFTFSYALVFSNRLWTMLFSGLLLLYLKPRRSRSTVIYEYSFPSISNMLSSWCQYEALRYVSFPATTLFKCFKIAPIMAMGRIILNKHYPNYDYIVALIIGVGISMFMASTDDLQFDTNIHGTNAQTW
eukprot:CAMPEP_0172493120 /NCGR_PEP_ID=MMETSP1066-20121228/24472_1 /TAXON_ID=671091 /ORGANISM="Coscinodiscus wailesii, Strain CCMP2513" /LENGTH=308 /DNA_ID=CAMNT_0013263119 /DNA_START=226 /DNA_END=1149 /DNA_ORIENTATION=-